MQIPETEIIVSENGVEILRKIVPPGDYVIGCDPACEVQIEAEGIFRRHAQLTVNYDHALIEDLGSSHGTFINGQPVKEPTRLWPNQKIQIGSATVELRRLKTVASADVSLAPTTATIRRALPSEFLHEKKYDIGGVIAQGGMGAILNAKEATTERTVAMKVMLHAPSPEDMVRFISEAKLTAQLEHPNVVPVHELSVDENDNVFYTMKMVRGITLRKVLELLAAGDAEMIRKFPLPQLLTIFQKVCDAVAFAHSKRVIHRDLKPENIMIGDYGEVLLMDWGLAKVLGGHRRGGGGESRRDGQGRAAVDAVGGSIDGAMPSSASPPADVVHGRGGARPSEAASATLAGTVMGTPQYMAPEQARGEVEQLDARADIYALGAILYHLLALRAPIEGEDAWEIVRRVAEGKVDSLVGGRVSPRAGPAVARGDTRPTPHLPGDRIPDSLAAVVRKAMALDRAARYPSVEALQAEITAYQSGFATSAEKAGLARQFTLLLQRHKGVSIAAMTALLLLVAVSAAFTIKVIRERDRSEAALARLRKAAPTLAAQAQSLVAEQKLDEAVEKLDFALTIDPNNTGYALQRANYLQAAQHLSGARDAYRAVLQRGPNAEASDSLTLCEKLLAAHGDAPLPDAALDELRAFLIVHHREAEAMPLAARLGKGKEAMLTVIRERLKVWEALPGWREDRIKINDKGGVYKGLITVDLLGLPVSDLSPLRGLYIEFLDISQTKVSDLRPLAGMRLRVLSASMLPQLHNLAGLEGAPLKILYVGNNGVSDLSPLRGSPLNWLIIGQTLVTDLSPIRDCPLTRFDAYKTAIQSIEVLRGKMLNQVALDGCEALTDISLLKDCPTLELLTLPPHVRDIEFLRNKPRLVKLSYGEYTKAEPVAEFWREYDAQRAAGTK